MYYIFFFLLYSVLLFLKFIPPYNFLGSSNYSGTRNWTNFFLNLSLSVINLTCSFWDLRFCLTLKLYHSKFAFPLGNNKTKRIRQKSSIPELFESWWVIGGSRDFIVSRYLLILKYKLKPNSTWRNARIVKVTSIIVL